MPIQRNVLERTIFFSLNQAPAPIIDLWSAITFRAVLAADRLGNFRRMFRVLRNSHRASNAAAG